MKKACSPQEVSRLAVYGQEVLEGLVGGPDLPHLAHQVRSDLEGELARLPARRGRLGALGLAHQLEGLYLAMHSFHHGVVDWTTTVRSQAAL
jgi:hypothetical protein